MTHDIDSIGRGYLLGGRQSDRIQYPHWRVEGRVFTNLSQARAWAEDYALRLAQAGRYQPIVTVMQRDDSMLPPFMLEKIDGRDFR